MSLSCVLGPLPPLRRWSLRVLQTPFPEVLLAMLGCYGDLDEQNRLGG